MERAEGYHTALPAVRRSRRLGGALRKKMTAFRQLRWLAVALAGSKGAHQKGEHKGTMN